MTIVASQESPQPDKLDTLFIGLFHGDEGLAAEVMLRFQAWLRTHPDHPALSHKAVGVVAVLNPDGWLANTRTNAAGVDLNRNFPTTDWQEQENGTAYYSGPKAASEPETKLVMELIDHYLPQKIITVHTPYKVINFDGPAQALAQAMASVIADGTAYPVVESIGYPTPGSFGTYAGKERNIAVITLELTEDQPIETLWQEIQPGLIEAIAYEKVDKSGHTAKQEA